MVVTNYKNTGMQRKFILQKSCDVEKGIFIVLDLPIRYVESMYTATRFNFYEAVALKQDDEIIRSIPGLQT